MRTNYKGVFWEFLKKAFRDHAIHVEVERITHAHEQEKA